MKFGVYTLVIENHMVRLPGFGMFDFGWGMGYVLLPTNHPFYGVDCDDIEMRVHGGLTFGQSFNTSTFLEWIKGRQILGDVTKENYDFFNNYWMIGFDTNHYDDNSQDCSKEFVIDETNSLLDKCLDDSIEKMKEYKSIYFRKDKLKKIDASVLALSSKQ